MSLKPVTPPTAIEELLDVMASLRHPIHGSPWEKEQTFASIAPNTLEEAYEVIDAISRDDIAELKGELGDLLLQVIFHSQIAREQGAFTFNEVAQTLLDKIKARLPHFFSGNAVSMDKQLEDWEKIKNAERARKGYTSALDGVALALPALARSQKLQERAARVGYTWPNLPPALVKVEEEWAETKEAIASGNKAHVAEEIGDTLLALVNLARMQGIDAESAMRAANAKFERRFRHIEQRLTAQGKSLPGATLEEMRALWNEAKSNEAA